jgi:hypothetical protein
MIDLLEAHLVASENGNVFQVINLTGISIGALLTGVIGFDTPRLSWRFS